MAGTLSRPCTPLLPPPHRSVAGVAVSLDVCNSTFDTKLWVGTGCPGGAAPVFGCTTASARDDAPGCGPANFGSRVAFTLPAGTRVLYAVVGGVLSGDSDMGYTIRWRVGGASWLAPSAAATGSASHTATLTGTATRSPTRPPSATRTSSRTAGAPTLSRSRSRVTRALRRSR